MAESDITVLVNKLMPKSWKCPRCGKANKAGAFADSILTEHGKYLEHCDRCGAVHCWELKLTESFKKAVVRYIREGKL